jgi:hypothetical protein
VVNQQPIDLQREIMESEKQAEPLGVDVTNTVDQSRVVTTDCIEADTSALSQPTPVAPEQDEPTWAWHPFFKRKLKRLTIPSRPDGIRERAPKDNDHMDASNACIDAKPLNSEPVEKPYISLAEAAKSSNRTKAELLQYACAEKINLCIQVPSGIDLIPYDKSTSLWGKPIVIPDKLILEKDHCEQIISTNKTTQSDFMKGYVRNFGKPKMIHPSYGIHAFMKDSCVWRAYQSKNSSRHHIVITQEDILVSKEELSIFILENPFLADELKARRIPPWSLNEPLDPENVKHPWYIPARYFALEVLKENPELSSRTLLAERVAIKLKEWGIFKRGGKEPLDSPTILKAFSNVRDIRIGLERNRKKKLA